MVKTNTIRYSETALKALHKTMQEIGINTENKAINYIIEDYLRLKGELAELRKRHSHAVDELSKRCSIISDFQKAHKAMMETHVFKSLTNNSQPLPMKTHQAWEAKWAKQEEEE